MCGPRRSSSSTASGSGSPTSGWVTRTGPPLPGPPPAGVTPAPSFEKVDQVSVERTDFVPDGTRATLVGLTLTSPQPRTLPIAVDAHSELMSAYPWGGTTPDAGTFNLQDTGSYRTYDGRGVLQFREHGHAAGPERVRTRLGGPGGRTVDAEIAPARPRPPWPAGPGRGLPRGRPGAGHLRRRRLRQGHRWPAALAGQAACRTSRRRSGSPWQARTRASRPRERS